MNKHQLKVPEGIKYLSDWGGFIDALPSKQHFILNKKICGCGASEAFLRTAKKVILASPRKHLLYDKFKQHLTDSFHLYRWADDKEKYFEGKPTENEAIQYDKNLKDYIKASGTKILVTYDSIQKISKAIVDAGDTLDDWIVVVDEFQAIFSDSQYKAETERQFCEELKQFSYVIYLSATPFMDDYLDEVSLFNSLPVYELAWGEDMTETPRVVYTELKCSITVKCKEIIDEYKASQGPVQGDVRSKEAVFYVNSVRDIIQIVKASGLKPEEVNIICSSTTENLKKIRSLGKGFELGDIPEKGQPHKMFTFCTSTVYIGADFYSTNACTFIFANPNIKSMAIDVSIDLQQILGRQRLDENPFRNSATLFFKTKAGKDKSDLDKVIQEKRDATKRQIANFNSAPFKKEALDQVRDSIKNHKHSNHYCCIVKDANKNETVEENELLIASEKRAWEIVNKIYQNDYTMYRAMKNGVEAKAKIDCKDKDLQTLHDEWVKDGSFPRKAQLYCKMYREIPDVLEKFTQFIPPKYKEYHDALGEEGMKANKWQEADIKKAIEEANKLMPIDHQAVYAELVNQLKEGMQYTKDKVKTILKSIYKKLHIPGSPSASDISNYITVKETSTRKSGKKVAMYEVISLYRVRISLFPIIGDVDNAKKWKVDDILNNIIKESKYYKVNEKVAKVRQAKTNAAKDKAKLLLPLVCWNGLFCSRSNKGLETYSSYTALDFDKIATDERMAELREWLKTFDCVYAIFITPSGKGLKAIILHDNFNPMAHYSLYKELLVKFDCPEIDKVTKDIGRGNFLSYDPDIWINKSAVPYHFQLDANKPLEGADETYVASKSDYGFETVDSPVNDFLNELCRQIIPDDKVIDVLRKRWTRKAISGGRNNAAMSYAGIFCLAGVEQGKAQKFIEELIPDFNLTEIMDYAYKHNAFGSRRRFYVSRKK